MPCSNNPMNSMTEPIYSSGGVCKPLCYDKYYGITGGKKRSQRKSPRKHRGGNVENNNVGISYATSAGGRKRRSNRKQRGGIDMDTQGNKIQGHLDTLKSTHARAQSNLQGGMMHYKDTTAGQPTNLDTHNSNNWTHTGGRRRRSNRKQRGGEWGAPIDEAHIKTPGSNWGANLGMSSGVSTQLLNSGSASEVPLYERHPVGIKARENITLSPTSQGINEGAFSQLLSTSADPAKLYETSTTTGGAKKRRSKNHSKRRHHKGGNGSDFATTLASRGPSNYPDQPEAMFRAFTKTADYIPNSKLWAAAAPCSTGFAPEQCNMGKVQAYNAADYASVTGGKKKLSKRKSPKRKSPKRKSPKRR